MLTSEFEEDGVSAQEFADIVEGRNKHPMLVEIDTLIQEEAAQTISATSAATQRHLQDCVQCRGVYDKMKQFEE